MKKNAEEVYWCHAARGHMCAACAADWRAECAAATTSHDLRQVMCAKKSMRLSCCICGVTIAMAKGGEVQS